MATTASEVLRRAPKRWGCTILTQETDENTAVGRCVMTGADAKTATEDEDAMASEAIRNEFSPAKGKKEKEKTQTNQKPTCVQQQL